MRSVFVCPSPPFQPCTATMVLPVLMMFSFSALRKPKRIRLSTYGGFLQYGGHASCAETTTYISLPLVRLDAAGLRVPEGVHAAVEVHLARGLLVAGDC